MNAADILNKAAQHMADRAATYDKPEGERSMGATVNAFYAATGVAMTEEQGWLFMALLKAVRSQQGVFRADSYEDGAAYFALAGEAAYADRNPSEEWKKVRDAARAEMAGRSCEVAKIDSGPMWVKSDGKGMPCAPGDVVEARLEDGRIINARAEDLRWLRLDRPDDVEVWRHPWPEDDRIDAIGQNGATGEHYDAEWTDAPEWANWKAQDSRGHVFWYEKKPHNKYGYEWFVGDGKIKIAGRPVTYNADWRLTLQPRPF